MIDLITNISSLISGIMVIVAFLGVMIKPIRKKIEIWLRNTTNAEELTNTMKAHTKQLNNLEYKIDQQETKSKKHHYIFWLCPKFHKNAPLSLQQL